MGRRVVLGLLGLGAASVLGGSRVARVLSSLSSHDPTGLLSRVPGAGWRYYTVTNGFPFQPPASYRLRVTGLVQRELDLGVADLAGMPRTRLTRDFQCVTGWRVEGARWEGVLLADLLDAAGADRGAHGVVFRSYDGTYTESLTTAQARRSDVLVADTLDGAAIGRAHGGPARLVVAPMYGYKSCKWLSEVEVTDRVRPGYWEGFGYDQDAWVGRSNGRSDAPTS